MRKRNRGWDVMRRVIIALFLREIKTRFGKYQLGYAWALVEPVSAIAVILIVFMTMGAHGYPGITFPVFLATGVVINSVFVEITTNSIWAIEANSALFNYRPVRPIDTVIARSLLELVLSGAVFVTLVGLYRAFGGDVHIHNLPLLLLVFILMGVFSCGIGILFMLVVNAYVDAGKVLPLITRPLFFISGVFFSIQALPHEYWPFLLWNPILHAIELARSAMAAGYYVIPGISLGYLSFSAIFSLTLAMALYQQRNKRLRLR